MTELETEMLALLEQTLPIVARAAAKEENDNLLLKTLNRDEWLYKPLHARITTTIKKAKATHAQHPQQ